MKELREFVALHKKNRFLISTTTLRQYEGLEADIGLATYFERVKLKQFRRTDIRQLVRKIGDENGSEEDLLNRVVSELRAINVPATPINSSLLLDIISRDSSFSPLNRPTLIERFIETLLKKRSLEEVERKKFDFRNHVHYLGHIAEYMCRHNLYVLKFECLFSVTDSYLKGLGLNFGAREIIDNTIQSKIFLDRKAEQAISFRFRAFLEFFVAAQMRTDPKFKTWVLGEDRYLSYLNEIEYYSGLERNDLAVLQTISNRHLQHQNIVFGPDFKKLLSNKKFGELPTSLAANQQFADEMAEQLQEAPLTPAQRDEVLDAELPQDAEGRQEVFRPNATEVTSKYMLSLFMYTNLVKNTELIEDTEKRYHLSCVLQSWASTIVGSFLAIPSLVTNRRLTINGLTYTVSYPRELSDDEVAKKLAISLPKEIGKLIYLLIATEKLEVQLTQKTSLELDEPNVVSFLRSSLYMDLKFSNWWKVPGTFFEQVRNDRYFQEVMLSKSADIYRLGAFPDRIGAELENQIVDNYARLYSPSKTQIQEIRNKKKASMKRLKNLNALRAKLPGNP